MWNKNWLMSFLLFLFLLPVSVVFGQQPDPHLQKLVQQAQSLLGQQKFAEAESLLQPALKSYPDKPGPSYLLGYALQAQQKRDEALTHYKKSATFPRTRTASLYNMACIYSLQDKKEQAFSALDQAIQSGFADFGQLQGDSDFDNLRDDPRFARLMPVWLSDEELFVEQSRIIHRFEGESAGDQFGWTARRAGDVDRDGIIDFIATAPTHNAGAGKVYLYSSATGDLLQSVEGKPGQQLGNSAVGIGDIDGDQVPDFIAGAPAPRGIGAAYVYSGKDASIIHSLQGTTSGGQFGYEVSETGDLDGDGIPDFLVGEMAGDGDAKQSGKIHVYSGQTSKPLFELSGEESGDRFGNAAACCEIGEGTFLLAVGAQDAGHEDRGCVYVYKVTDAQPRLHFRIEGDENSVNLGQMFLSFPGDLNGDDIPDVYASDFSDNSGARGGGKIVIHSGADGSRLLEIAGKVAGEGLGTSPSDAGDVDGDGVGDLVVGAWQNNQGATSGGKVYLFSCGKQGKLLQSWTCRQSGDTLGFDACGIGDVDGDGHVDFLLTSAWSSRNGARSGRVFIVAGADHTGVD